ncbi:MAG: hypothetical protein ABSF81_10030 [Bacteroidales bacterium]|jgi:hypothetical protein
MKFIDDLVELNKLKKEELDLLLNEFNKNPLLESLDFANFESFCANNNIDIDVAGKFYSILAYICRFFIKHRSISIGIEKIEESIIKPHYKDVDNIWIYIKDNIPNLKDFIYLRKERDLHNVNEGISSFNIYCDVRPLYDISRKEIVKYTFPIIISIQPEEANERIVYEINEQELIEIKDDVDAAIGKLELLKKSLKK